MSIEAVAWALRQPVADRAAKLILIGLAEHHNPSTDVCWPSKKRLAEVACCSEATVTRKLALLVKQGRIEVEPRHCENGRQTSNSYKLKMAEKPGAQAEPLPPSNGGGRGAPCTPRGCHSCEPPILEPQKEEKEARASASPVDKRADDERIRRGQQLRALAAELAAAARPKAECRRGGTKALMPAPSGLSPSAVGEDQPEPCQEDTAKACLPEEAGLTTGKGLGSEQVDAPPRQKSEATRRGTGCNEGDRTSIVRNTERLERWVGRVRRELATVMARPPDLAPA